MYKLKPCYCLLCLLLYPYIPISYATDDGYSFDLSLLRGSKISQQQLEQLNHIDDFPVGNHRVDLFINGQFLLQDNVDFFTNHQHQVVPCLSAQQIAQIGLKQTPKSVKPSQCLMLGASLPNVNAQPEMSKLKLNLLIPQALLASKKRPLTAANLSAGNTMLFVNYNLNQYHIDYRQQAHNRLDSTYLNMDGGFNIGLWRYRQQSNYHYDKLTGSHWDTTRRYLQRAIFPWRSELLVGQGFTMGQFFAGLAFNGIQLHSDDRMLPDALRGYAPVVKGIAKSNAKVTIRQGNSILYETTVPPGPFSIDDLYATNYAGDLTVIVTEADGSVNSFKVPFSAVPESVRPGINHYWATLGKTRYSQSHDYFGEWTLQRGLTNAITFNLGNQLADGYQAMMLGGVYSDAWGALGLDATYSHARLPEKNSQGWMLHLSYSKNFQPTNTTISLASYRYSTEGFRQLSDVLSLRHNGREDEQWLSDNYLQRSRWEAAITQDLGLLGNLTLFGSTQDYRNNRSHDNQLQLGWGKTFHNNIALNVSVARTRSLVDQQTSENPTLSLVTPLANKTQTLAAMSISLPLSYSPTAPILSLSDNYQQNQGSSLQTSLSGTLGDENPLSYGLNFSTDDHHNDNLWSGNLQAHTAYGNISSTLSFAKQYWQTSLSLQGAIVAHAGGLTIGPYLGDTFALVHAPGATGAKIIGGQGATIDRFGYALVPSLLPYHYNTISLDPAGLNNQTELVNDQQRVAPAAGAMLALYFKTINGQALLITAQPPHHQIIPMGSQALNEQGQVVGMVGQANQIYLRAQQHQGRLTLRWGKQADQQCQLNYQVIDKDTSPLQLLTAPCR